MERNESPAEHSLSEKLDDLISVFGESGTTKLLSQLTHDNPALTSAEALDHAWSLISEATAYALPASQETLTESAINIHEGYEAFRRIQD